MKFWNLEVTLSMTSIKLTGEKGKLSTKDLKNTEQAAGKIVRTEKN